MVDKTTEYINGTPLIIGNTGRLKILQVMEAAKETRTKLTIERTRQLVVAKDIMHASNNCDSKMPTGDDQDERAIRNSNIKTDLNLPDHALERVV